MQAKSYIFQPFVRLIIPLILGIIMQNVFEFSFIFCSILFLFFLGSFITSLFFKNYHKFDLSGILIFFVFFALGILSLSTHRSSEILPENERIFMARLLDIPEEKKNSYKADIQVEAVKIEENWKKQNFPIVAYFSKDSSIQKLKAGQPIAFLAKLEEVSSRKNPFDFDYRAFLALKNIEKTVYLQTEQWQAIDNSYKGVKAFAMNLRQKIINLFITSGIEDEELGVLSALTLGYKSKLDAELKKAYSGAGAMHVLAVSGMHVGIIFLVLNGFFNLLLFFNKNSRIKYLLIILSLWLYALLTGLSTSVLRASLMFSFILFGKLFNKHINIYNSLSASALCLLLLNPNTLFELGFQLSYLAVLGIVFFYPRIYKMIKVKNFILDKMWQLTSVSIAAQLATTPLSLFYFHQFPTYFWLSNIVVSLSASLLMLSSILLVVISPFHYLATFIGGLLSHTTYAVNEFIIWINQLPYSVIKGINLDNIETWLIYTFLATFLVWISIKKHSVLLVLLSVLLIFSLYHSYQQISVLKQEAICVYDVPNASVLQLIEGKNSTWSVSEDKKIKQDFFYQANLFWKTKKNKKINIDEQKQIVENNFRKTKQFVKTKQHTFFIIDEDTKPYLSENKVIIDVDFILLRGNVRLKPEEIPTNINYKKIVIDRSVPIWVSKNWEKQYTYYPLHITKQQGAFILQK